MPHQCTNCGRLFEDGSKEMLSGCPGCGGNKFQFKPASATVRESSDAAADSPSEPHPSRQPANDVTDGTATDGEPSPDASPHPPSPSTSASGSETTPDGTTTDTDAEVQRGAVDAPPSEDNAQASARSDMVSADELADAASLRRPGDGVDGRVVEPRNEDGEDRPGLDELREALNSQFESIKIVGPGQYELNLMELYDRQEYIISLQEDGRYVIEVPDSWGDPDEA